jgi:hypothetical protein
MPYLIWLRPVSGKIRGFVGKVDAAARELACIVPPLPHPTH